MFTVTINGNTIEELYANMQKLLGNQPGAQMQATAAQQAPLQPPTPQHPPMGNIMPPANVPAAQPTLPEATTPTVPTNPAPLPHSAPTTPPTMTMTSPSNIPPQAPAPTYTPDQLAKAGAALAQAGKMVDALALLARYGVQSVNQLKPEQYGAFATELRALGAQV